MNLVDRIRNREIRAAAQLMRDLDDGIPSAQSALRDLYRIAGRSNVIGITGNPGCGKSSLVDGMVTVYRRQGKRVGVVAVDPSSPYSGGAILGDRIRMQQHATDPGVFIRSIASRGHLGGLSRSTNDIVLVMEAMGFDAILIETVGVGQAEVDIVETAHVSVVVVVPGLGDEIQALKAGVLEIADVLCVNKADREGADRAVQDLEMMLALWQRPSRRLPKVMHTVALSGAGVAELVGEIDGLLGESPDHGAWEARASRRARRTVEDLLRQHLLGSVLPEVAQEIDRAIPSLVDRTRDPYSFADELLEEILDRRP